MEEKIECICRGLNYSFTQYKREIFMSKKLNQNILKFNVLYNYSIFRIQFNWLVYRNACKR